MGKNPFIMVDPRITYRKEKLFWDFNAVEIMNQIRDSHAFRSIEFDDEYIYDHHIYSIILLFFMGFCIGKIKNFNHRIAVVVDDRLKFIFRGKSEKASIFYSTIVVLDGKQYIAYSVLDILYFYNKIFPHFGMRVGERNPKRKIRFVDHQFTISLTAFFSDDLMDVSDHDVESFLNSLMWR